MVRMSALAGAADLECVVRSHVSRISTRPDPANAMSACMPCRPRMDATAL
jgi:hypothetical protein